ncbi:hypothetical protein LTR16_008344 [Cryomyces antarcticus]|uniref:Uncharacterized protein n=1 Tax=Cryomyces antarcticus TaxID=329879 RepID=A0ABR0M3F7_9PEZI|nr:hypothetical protein LTR16_008344 [Cryomyces antarcticus]
MDAQGALRKPLKVVLTPKLSVTATNQNRQSATYMCDDNGILQEDVDPLTWPTETIATRLLTLFFDNVHGDFPILSRLMLKDKFTTYFAAVAKGGAVEHPPPQWRAQINLILLLPPDIQT